MDLDQNSSNETTEQEPSNEAAEQSNTEGWDEIVRRVTHLALLKVESLHTAAQLFEGQQKDLVREFDAIATATEKLHDALRDGKPIQWRAVATLVSTHRSFAAKISYLNDVVAELRAAADVFGGEGEKVELLVQMDESIRGRLRRFSASLLDDEVGE